MIRRAAVVALTIGVLACPAGASAAPEWLEPATVFDQSASQGVTAAMAPDGTAMIARVRALAPYQVLEAVVKRPGEPPAPPLEIARSGAGGSMALLKASAGADGRFAVTYHEGDRHLVTLAPDGRVIDRFDNPPGPINFGSDGTPVLDGHGGTNYVVEANGVDGINGIAVYRRRAGAGKVLPIPHPPGTDPTAVPFAPYLHATPDGRLLVVYTMGGRLPGDGNCDLVTDVWMTEGTGDTLGPATKVMGGRVTGVETADGCTDRKGLLISYAAVGVDAAGATTVAFQQRDMSNGNETVGALHRPAGGSWGPVESVGQSILGPLRLTLAGSTPTVTVENTIVLSAVRGADGKWRPPAPLYAHFNVLSRHNAVASLPDGSTVYVWADSNPLGTGALLARRALPDGTLEEPVIVSNARGSLPAVGNDAAGNVIVAFIGAGGKRSTPSSTPRGRSSTV